MKFLILFHIHSCALILYLTDIKGDDAVCPSLTGHNFETLDNKLTYQYGEEANLTCKAGYTLIGQEVITCLQSGQWNETIPKCEEVDECLSDPCLNGGRCTDRLDAYTCTCHASFIGINCQYDISKCDNLTCLNGGICKDVSNDTLCICQLGYTGEYCQHIPAINIAPQIFLAAKITFDEGSSMRYIPCFAEGIPLPNITWESIDKVLLPSNAKQVLHYLMFTNITLFDGGLYMCTAKNEMGTDIKVVHVTVNAKPAQLHTAPVIHSSLSTVKVDYYTNAKLVCQATGFPTPSITWKYNNKVLQTSGSILVVRNVTNTTTGSYTCIASNDVGTNEVKILLQVTYDTPHIVIPPTTAVIMVGQSRNFTCIATGHPNPSITWSFKSFAQESTKMPSNELHQDGHVLTLFALKTLESGTLTCTATNDFGEDKASAAVIFRNPVSVFG